MGVPSFYRWVAEKYPKTVIECVESDSEFHHEDCMLPNPNGIEYDCKYAIHHRDFTWLTACPFSESDAHMITLHLTII